MSARDYYGSSEGQGDNYSQQQGGYNQQQGEYNQQQGEYNQQQGQQQGGDGERGLFTDLAGAVVGESRNKS